MSAVRNSSSKFQYKTLEHPDSIRVLLNPSSASPANLHCNLLCTTILECDQDLFEHYVALSYVWGSTDNLQTIILEGCQFQVTKNLHDALQNIQNSRRVIRLWVDAICINQQDEKERSQQVALMGQIYSIAQHTIIYLGDSTPGIDFVFKEAVELEKQSNDWNGISCDEDLDYYRVIDRDNETTYVSRMKLVAGELLARPWFTRVWVFQELVLSRDPWVQCGKSRLKWATFCSALLNGRPIGDANFNTPTNPEYLVPEHPKSMLSTLQSLWKMRYEHRINVEKRENSQHTLLDLVQLRRGLGASDPRDIIYGHMGLVQKLATSPDHGHLSISDKIQKTQIEIRFKLGTSEYHKSVQGIFMDFAHDVINSCRHFQIFCYNEVLCPSKRLPHLASWAPD